MYACIFFKYIIYDNAAAKEVHIESRILSPIFIPRHD